MEGKTTLLRTLRVFFIVSLLFLALAASASASRSCGQMILGPDGFFNIRASGVSCTQARALIDGATLTKNRPSATADTWTFRGWRWTKVDLDVLSSELTGTKGQRRITTKWVKG